MSKTMAPEMKDVGRGNPCPGDGVRGCLAYVHGPWVRCTFCRRTIALRRGEVPR